MKSPLDARRTLLLHLIESHAHDRLDSLQVRGTTQCAGNKASYCGYDYAAQRWIEHSWRITT